MEQRLSKIICSVFKVVSNKTNLACVASVSARVRRESWDESKKKGMTGKGRGKKEICSLYYFD